MTVADLRSGTCFTDQVLIFLFYLGFTACIVMHPESPCLRHRPVAEKKPTWVLIAMKPASMSELSRDPSRSNHFIIAPYTHGLKNVAICNVFCRNG